MITKESENELSNSLRGVERRLLAYFSHVRVIDVNCFDRSVDGVGRRGFGTTHAVRLDGDGRREQQQR